jgi:hypothetical protein
MTPIAKRIEADIMTDKDFVVRSVEVNRLDLLKPSKEDRTILILDSKRLPAKVAVEALTWADARAQLSNYLLKFYV